MKKFKNILWGLVFISLGVLLGLMVTGIIDVNIFFDGWWTLFIIIPCTIGFFTESPKTGNLIGIFIGAAILLSAQNVISFELIWKLMLPAILVIIGCSFIFKDVAGKKIVKEIDEINKKNNYDTDNEYFAAFSGQNINFDSEVFKGTNLTATFGGMKCDLRNSIIEENIVVNATAIFGGIDIIVPDNINVKVKSSSIFGGVSDKNKRPVIEGVPTLYINATCVFGGVEIK